MKRYSLYIDGESKDAISGRTFLTHDPGTGAAIAAVADGDVADIDAAVAAARRAFEAATWSRLPARERALILHDWADIIQSELMDIAVIESRDSGGILSRIIGDVFQSVRFIRNMAHMAAHELRWQEPVRSGDPLFPAARYLRREPIGVVAAILPWNIPLLSAVWKIAPAIAAGNTIVVKPAPQTPLSALRLAATIAASEIPNGVVNVVTGSDDQLGRRLSEHPQVERITFTGSTEVGRKVFAAASSSLKRVSLELGGKSANIVLPDADLDLAADGSIFAAFLHSGQMCVAGSRLLAHESVHDELLARIVERASAIQIGHQLHPATRIGPVIGEEHLRNVVRAIELGKTEGARLVLGGEPVVVPGAEDGWYLPPTIFTGVRGDMTIAREEIFGPVLCVMPFSSESEALAIANDTRFGLAAGIWSRDLGAAEKLAAELRAGTVWINDWHALNDHAPFGGYRDSGVGREFGLEGLESFTEVKYVHVGTESDPGAKIGHRLLVKRPPALAYSHEPATRIVSGPGCVARLRELLPELGCDRALLITDSGVVGAGLVERVREVLGDRIAAVFSEVPAGSGFAIADEAAEAGRRARVDLVLSLGGGSVLDTGKMAAALIPSKLRALEIVGVNRVAGAVLPHVAIPTTAGTGSEVTDVAVIRNERLQMNSYVIGRALVPAVALLDPRFVCTSPRLVALGAAMDCLTHAIESYTGRSANPMTDAQALHATRLVSQWLPELARDEVAMAAHAGLQSAATLAGWAISGSGGGVGLVHAMSHILGSRFGLPHGLTNGVLLPHVMRWNAGSAYVARRLEAVLAALSFDVSVPSSVGAAGAIEHLLERSGHPRRLRDLGFSADGIEIASLAALNDPAHFNNGRRVGDVREIRALYTAAL